MEYNTRQHEKFLYQIISQREEEEHLYKAKDSTLNPFPTLKFKNNVWLKNSYWRNFKTF